jgi:hypothetical protein
MVFKPREDSSDNRCEIEREAERYTKFEDMSASGILAGISRLKGN